MALALVMSRHRRLGGASPLRHLDDLALNLILHSPARPFPGLPVPPAASAPGPGRTAAS